MDYGSAVLALLILNEATLLRILFALEGNSPSLIPSLTGRLIKRRYAMTVNKLKNMGDVKPVPNISRDLEYRFTLAVFEMYKTGAEIKLTEAEWVSSGKWAGMGGTNAQQFRDLLDMWGEDGIIERKNPSAQRSTWILARGGIGKLKKKFLPTIASPTAKTM
jgi:hypothetical protein